MNSLFSSIGLALIATTSAMFVPVTTIAATFDYSPSSALLNIQLIIFTNTLLTTHCQ